MHLCFIDESGSPPKPGRQGARRYFVIAGVVMHEAQWSGVAQELKKLRSRKDFRVTGEIKWRYFGPDNDDEDNSVAHLEQAKRNEFRDELFSIITQRKSIRIIACVADSEAAYAKSYVNTEEQLYRYTYKPISERFQYYLQDVSRTVGDTQYGIVVADHRGKRQDDLLRRHHHGLVDYADMFISEYQNYIETIFLTPSHHSVGIQLADMVAGAVGRAFNTNDTAFADSLIPSFRARPNGDINGYGLVKFPMDGWEGAAGWGLRP